MSNCDIEELKRIAVLKFIADAQLDGWVISCASGSYTFKKWLLDEVMDSFFLSAGASYTTIADTCDKSSEFYKACKKVSDKCRAEDKVRRCKAMEELVRNL